MTWKKLFRQFTEEIKPEIRMQVLRAIGNPATKIGHSWENCLYAVALAAARGEPLESVWASYKSVAKALGLRVDQVQAGVFVWDSDRNGKACRRFRERIATFVKKKEQEALIREIEGIEAPAPLREHEMAVV